ncbi:chemotaxis protein CheB [Algoriphagus sp. D3-2-R+10]|uniref:chemotaxis protein CheB n=1 Tax=Algoriphagus aurantiacus TaxID=3103948 RepID=UPI002B3A82BD|nr:chemotaxis protein CheB [Algoriphagus sp. D3-2-R+10]MEB2778156.1 chemotaxis protein CheB [Algoriphagus sp. D3-2-R+10]
MKTIKPKQEAIQKETSEKEKTNESSNGLFPIVGIGASAGGLEALEQFLSNVPEDSGLGFVVIQHLDPTQKGMLPELLQRKTKMKVLQAVEGIPVEPDKVYVIPPNKSMSITKGNLHLFEPKETRGMRLPIDFFLKSLAEDRKDHGVGIILSGMGSDGSAGISSLKEQNGRVLVQTPETAQFDSMPRSAIEAITVDIVAPANELPVKLIELLKHKPVKKSNYQPEIEDKNSLDRIITLLRSYTGNDFSQYKKNTLYRRIERRMAVHKIDKITSYVHFLQENPKEGDILFKELMIGVTNFFRDVIVWDYLKTQVIPAIINNIKSEPVLRAWVPACSTGEEAYSLAILFKEVLTKINRTDVSIQIFATDLDNDAIERARKGVFLANIISDVSPARLKRFFVKTGEGYRINTEIREMVVFAQHNLTMHPPFTKIDFISCRNLLIYMDGELQKKIIGLFYYSINPEGILVLGSSESLGSQSNLFSSLENKLKIYQKTALKQSPESFEFPTSFSKTNHIDNEEKTPVQSLPNIQALADQLLLKYFSPVGVLVNEEGDIIYTSGRTGKYLEPSVGKANLNIFAMLREGLRQKFPVAFRKVVKKKETIVLQNIKVGTNGDTQTLDISIRPIEHPEQLNGNVMVIFKEVTAVPNVDQPTNSGSKSRQAELEEELRQLHSEMQNTVEEMQTSQEELKSTNEELQSTNEELQSTNEELTSSKEEMQSLNEELQTVNAELLTKVEDYSRVNNDMKNLLNSTDIATLFLDKKLNIRRFTNQATKIFKLIKSDIGRPFTDQVTDLIYPELENDALEVLKTLVFIEKQIPAKDGRWFTIRIMPYRTNDDRIDGLVITFINISDLKQLEVDLEENGQINRMWLDSTSDIFISLSDNGEIKEFNPKAELFFGKKRDEVLGKNFVKMFVAEPERSKTQKEIIKLAKQGKPGTFKMPVLIAGNKKAIVTCTFQILISNLKTPKAILMMLNKE